MEQVITLPVMYYSAKMVKANIAARSRRGYKVRAIGFEGRLLVIHYRHWSQWGD